MFNETAKTSMFEANENGEDGKMKNVLASLEYSPSGAYSIMWPYVAMSGI